MKSRSLMVTIYMKKKVNSVNMSWSSESESDYSSSDESEILETDARHTCPKSTKEENESDPFFEDNIVGTTGIKRTIRGLTRNVANIPEPEVLKKNVVNDLNYMINKVDDYLELYRVKDAPVPESVNEYKSDFGGHKGQLVIDSIQVFFEDIKDKVQDFELLRNKSLKEHKKDIKEYEKALQTQGLFGSSKSKVFPPPEKLKDQLIAEGNKMKQTIKEYVVEYNSRNTVPRGTVSGFHGVKGEQIVKDLKQNLSSIKNIVDVLVKTRKKHVDKESENSNKFKKNETANNKKFMSGFKNHASPDRTYIDLKAKVDDHTELHNMHYNDIETLKQKLHELEERLNNL